MPKKKFQVFWDVMLCFYVFPTFRLIAFPSSLWSNNPRRKPSGENWSYYIGNFILFQANTIQAWTGCEGSWRLRLPDIHAINTVTTVPQAGRFHLLIPSCTWLPLCHRSLSALTFSPSSRWGCVHFQSIIARSAPGSVR